MADIQSGLNQTLTTAGQFLNIGLIAIPCILIVFYLFLVWRKRNRLKIPACEVRTLGSILKEEDYENLKNGSAFSDILKDKEIDDILSKFSLKFFKAGIFGRDIYMKMLFWKGDRTYRLSDTSVIYGMSDSYWQEVNGKRGIVFIRDPKNSHICIPIKGLKLSGTEVFAAVAPAPVKTAITDYLRKARRETQPQNSQTLQMIGLVAICITIIVGIVFMTNYGGKITSEGQKYVLDAQGGATAQCAAICKEAATAVCGQVKAGNAP